ncbi:MAG: hypothetical protein PHR68_04300 [Candidatus Gracilibacteria bacterium]|nr:hypothetical protein [Candidatus Gracilibacteria bacterium]
MIVKFKKKFDKSYNKLDKKIQIKFKDNFRLFQKYPFDKSLNNHSLD